MLPRFMLVVVGSLAYDRLKTPFGERDRVLGGSATHFSIAASFFTEVGIVGVVGGDFDDDGLFEKHGIATGDIERIEDGETFYWDGEYGYDLNNPTTHETRLNVFETFKPRLSEESRKAETLFLGNIQPMLQMDVRSQCTGANLVALDSMNLWIDTARKSLLEAIASVDIVMINDTELRKLTDEPNMLKAARRVLSMGPQAVVTKQGEYGASLYTSDMFFGLPAFPLDTVLDPTGAGDSFAGGFLGYLDAHRTESLDEEILRRAMTYGSAMASFNVERFGTERVTRLTLDEINGRFRDFKRFTHFEEIVLEPSDGEAA